MMERETNGGQSILVTEDGTAWIGCAGEFGPDDLRDIADALEGDYNTDADEE